MKRLLQAAAIAAAIVTARASVCNQMRRGFACDDSSIGDGGPVATEQLSSHGQWLVLIPALKLTRLRSLPCLSLKEK